MRRTAGMGGAGRRGIEPGWWRHAVVYEIYPRAFADEDGDGLGDLRGVTSRVAYLRALGVDAVWLTPFYPSALADGGYDVDDYRDVDPRLGTLAHFDEMVRALHAAGLKVVIDIVPNHSSNRHPWFREALAAAAGARARQRYVFRDGAGPEGTQPPNDWQSLFGGSAWEPVGDGQWYFHHFAKEQPDLNWDDEDVRADFLTTLRFWADRGVDGFRVDAAHGLVKDLSLPYIPWAQIADWYDVGGHHPLWDQDEVHEIYASWRKVFDDYDPPLFGVAEAGVPDRGRRARYAAPEGLGQTFNFDTMDADWTAASFHEAIDTGLRHMRETGATTTWLLGCHDSVRVATRYGMPRRAGSRAYEVAQEWLRNDGADPPLDRQLGERRARAAILLLLALPGSTYVYQGDELGLHEVGDLPAEVLEDPLPVRSGGRWEGRDGCRVPLPWTPDGPSFGFGPGPPRLPQPAWFAAAAVSRQETEATSTLNLYRAALAIRRGFPPVDDASWRTADPEVLHVARPDGWHTVTNFGSGLVPLPQGTVLLASAPLEAGLLPPDTTAWVVPGR
ncbi:alpha-amylase family glycosyl hydrolase [Blastococcus sp. PRF04-17]|uniref:alpha-amylase family glycosyl hydrolase n=1 Tax=Blastococcus sp. PRF04-17 TaxID=2933797 RepID=UPI001FF63356|nr:alpha-amylase family glycosyl hydrolase [Blastococcus sp. PRF04-17]UOY00169.1 alpha-amylase family glycosyl hydrolase [Blastococcus sp. PRF04-17]